ncbi:MAG: hypothetical protein KDB22_26770 [Planctomycetales bacterium]|nr:hypothetical protein [Planctomycetales bacterium]
MAEINIANSEGRDAQVALASVASTKTIRWIDEQQRQASSVRFVKATLDHELSALTDRYGEAAKIAQALIDGDPEIDLENTGRFLRETARVYVDKHRGIVRNVRFWEIIKNADGTVRERRPRQLADTNISADSPLRWSGVFVNKAQAIRKFVFSSKAQLQHVNGLTYDFLFAMARDLEERKSLMLLGAGPKSQKPLILRRGGTPYRGFLEGRTEGDKYCLLLHFSNLELKTPQTNEAEK